MKKKLVSMVSAKGKTPDEVAAEMIAAVQRYRDATAAADRRSADSASDDDEASPRSDSGR
jgi:hypothetical protein